MQTVTAIDTTCCPQRTGFPWFSDSYVKFTGAPADTPPPPPTVTDAIDFMTFDAIAESAEIAEGLCRQVVEAADRGERLRVRAYAGLLSRAVRNTLLAVAELGVVA
jgi:hypothetical protein